MRTDFDFIDLFAGIGGFRLAFEPIGGKCVFTAEIDKHARRTYEANFAVDHPFVTDITKVANNDIPPHDVLLAGFPCQSFSTIAKHIWREAIPDTLFYEIVRILEYGKPAAFLLENVPNLKLHDAGRTFKVIMRALRDVGYYVQCRVITAESWVPQTRRRLFFAGFREKNDFDFGGVRIPVKRPVLKDILETEVGDEYTIRPERWARAREGLFPPKLRTPDQIATTLTSNYQNITGDTVIAQHDKPPRYMTGRECARLQGFDDDFKLPVSKTQIWKQMGNAVCVPCVAAIANHMARHIDGATPCPVLEKTKPLDANLSLL